LYITIEGECKVQIKENVRGADVYIIQPTCPPVNDHIIELLVVLDALKRSSVSRITAVIPYYGYARQDRKMISEFGSSVPITAKLVADIITAAGADRVLILDLHAGQIQGFFTQPVDNLKSDQIFINYVNEKYGSSREDVVIVAPDSGGAKRAKRIASKTNSKFCLIDTRRVESDGNSIIESMKLIGDVTENAFIIDDIIDTGQTVVKAAITLQNAGVINVYVCATHGVLSSNAIEFIENSPIKEVIITDTIPHLDLKDRSKKLELFQWLLFLEKL
jgi:ribose-phosphate pyrophosphokinase